MGDVHVVPNQGLQQIDLHPIMQIVNVLLIAFKPAPPPIAMFERLDVEGNVTPFGVGSLIAFVLEHEAVSVRNSPLYLHLICMRPLVHSPSSADVALSGHDLASAPALWTCPLNLLHEADTNLPALHHVSAAATLA